MTNKTETLEYIKQLKFLVAEDSLINRKLLELLLKQQEINADFVENGRQAVDKLTVEHQYDVLLIDLEMPVMNGYEAVAYIRSVLKSPLLIIAMSGYSDAQERSKCIDQGMNEYVSKPIDMQLLFDKIYTLLHNEEEVVLAELVDAEIKHTHTSLDLSYLRTLSRGNTNFEIKILEIFSQDVPPQLDTLLKAIAQHDKEEVLQITHKMKTSTKMLGLEEVCKLLETIESQFAQGEIKEDNLSRSQSLKYMLDEAFAEINNELQMLRANTVR